MTLEAIYAAQAESKLATSKAYHALIMTIRDNQPALHALSELASAALETQLLDQIALDVIANGTTGPANISRLAIAQANAEKGWPPCPCGNVIDIEDELVCAECRASIGA
jgi:hypothetical protein